MRLHGFGASASARDLRSRNSSGGLGDHVDDCPRSASGVSLKELNSIMEELRGTDRYVGSSAFMTQMALQRLAERRLAERRRESQALAGGKGSAGDDEGGGGGAADQPQPIQQRLANLVSRCSRNSHVENLGGGKPWDLLGPSPSTAGDLVANAGIAGPAARGPSAAAGGRARRGRGRGASSSHSQPPPQRVIHKRMSVTVPAFNVPREDPALLEAEAGTDDDGGGSGIEEQGERSLSDIFMKNLKVEHEVSGSGGGRQNDCGGGQNDCGGGSGPPLMLGSLLSRASMAGPNQGAPSPWGSGSGAGGWQGRAIGFLRGGGRRPSPTQPHSLSPPPSSLQDACQGQVAPSGQAQAATFLARDRPNFDEEGADVTRPRDNVLETPQPQHALQAQQQVRPCRRSSGLISLGDSSFGSLDDADLAAIQRTAARCGGLVVPASAEGTTGEASTPSPLGSNPGSRRQSTVRRRSTGAFDAGDHGLTAAERAAEEEAAVQRAKFQLSISQLEKSLGMIDPTEMPESSQGPQGRCGGGPRRSSLTRPQRGSVVRRGSVDSAALRSIQESLPSDFDDDGDGNDDAPPSRQQEIYPRRRSSGGLGSLGDSSFGSLDDADLVAIQQTAARCGGLVVAPSAGRECSTPSPLGSNPCSRPGSRRQSAVRRRSTGAFDAGERGLTAAERSAEEEAAVRLAEFQESVSHLERQLERSLGMIDPADLELDGDKRPAALGGDGGGRDGNVSSHEAGAPDAAQGQHSRHSGGHRRSSLTSRPNRRSSAVRRCSLDSTALRSIREDLPDFDDGNDNGKPEEGELTLEEVFGLADKGSAGGLDDVNGNAPGGRSVRRHSLGSCSSQSLLVGWGECYDDDDTASESAHRNGGHRRGSMDSQLSQGSYVHHARAQESLLIKWRAHESSTGMAGSGSESCSSSFRGGRGMEMDDFGGSQSGSQNDGDDSCGDGSLIVRFHRRASLDAEQDDGAPSEEKSGGGILLGVGRRGWFRRSQ